VVFPVHGSPTVKNSVGCCFISTSFPSERLTIADIRSCRWRALDRAEIRYERSELQGGCVYVALVNSLMFSTGRNQRIVASVPSA